MRLPKTMTAKHKLLSLSLLFLVTACATSSGVQRLGPDTFVVSSQVMFGPGKASSARASALAEAEAFCAKLGKEVLVDEYKTAGHAMSLTGDSEVRFKCLARGDEDLKRPSFQPNPNVIIEDRRR